MRLPLIRRPLVVALFAGLLAASGCDRDSERVPSVTVVGTGKPELVDPRQGPLDPPDAVLVANAAQGLVRFDASGQIVPGLAETWNVSDDGLSYIFRLANTEWPNGRAVTAEQVARILRRLIGPSSRNPLKDAFGAVAEIVAMTDRVIEIRLRHPRPHLLQLLAQPQMGLVFNGMGTGPFRMDGKRHAGALHLVREVPAADGDEPQVEALDLSASPAGAAITSFREEHTDLVLGGAFQDLPLVREARIPRKSVVFDPASGHFGLSPVLKSGIIANPEVRRLLSAAIDRDALIATLDVPGLMPRTTVLEPGLDDLTDPVPPQWTATPLEERRPALAAIARRLFADEEQPVVRVRLPDGPGADLLLQRLAQDWGALGLRVERARPGAPADLELIDQVAPSSSAAWYVRRFRCGTAPVCSEEVDEILEGARNTPILVQRAALLAEAAKRIDELQLFIPLAAPIRWSLVSGRINGFTGNRFAVHTLTGLEERLDRTGQ
jgi:peptide/nickel transport system substrate-binding protein